MMMTFTARFLCVAQSTILAVLHFPRFGQGYVLNGMTQSRTTPIANGHFSFHLNYGNLVHQFQCVAAVFAQRVLSLHSK
jgi:hypothetical protein